MISKKSKIIDVIREKPASHEVMVERGLHCIGCSGAAFESLEDGARAHGLSDKDIDDLVKEIKGLK